MVSSVDAVRAWHVKSEGVALTHMQRTKARSTLFPLLRLLAEGGYMREGVFRGLSFAPLRDDGRSCQVDMPTRLLTIIMDCDADSLVPSQG